MTISSEQTWAIFWFSIVVAICVLITSCTVMYNREDARKAQDVKALVAAGQSPIEARCAVYGANDTDKLVCRTAATSTAIIKSLKEGAAK